MRECTRGGAFRFDNTNVQTILWTMQPLLIIGIAQGLFAFIYFLSKRPRTFSDTVVSVFMLTLALPLGLKLMNFYIRADGVLFSAVFAALPFTYGPFLLLYTISVITERVRLSWLYMLHVLPFIVIVLAYVLMPIGLPNELSRVRPPADASRAAREMAPPRSDRAGDPRREERMGARIQLQPEVPRARIELPRRVNVQWIAVFTLISASYLGYSIAILLTLARHRRSIADYFSSQSNATTLAWLSWTAAAFLITGIFIGVFTTLIPAVMSFRGIPPGIADAYGLTFFMFVFSMFSVKQPALYAGTEARDADTRSKDAVRYERSGLAPAEAKRHREALETYMAKEKPYRNSDLTIVDVASALSMRRHHLTQVINDQLKMNFYTYINKLRLNEVMDHINEGADGESLLVIAFDAGFNSKSTFNRVFKESTGMTPSEYRKGQSQK